MKEVRQRGFTLIELLIVVAILGVLVAVVIPNVARFIGRGEKEAAETELGNIQSAVIAMMVDNQLAALPNPVSINATSDMGAFPDTSTIAGGDKSTDPDGKSYTSGQDKDGFILYQHDITADGSSTNATVNYVASQYTKGTYTVDATGTVTRVTTGYE